MNEKVDKYFKLLYPEYDTLEAEEEDRAMSDKVLIRQHIDEIDAEYERSLQEGSYAQQKGWTEQQIIQTIISQLQTKQITSEQTEKETINNSTVKKQEAKHVEADKEVALIDESKFAKIYDKAKGRIGVVLAKIKSFLHIQSKEDKTNEEK